MVADGRSVSPKSPVSPPQFNINVSPTISANQSNTQSTAAPEDGGRSAAQPGHPDIKAVTYKAAFARGIGNAGANCFIMSFRNDGWAAATNVIAQAVGFAAQVRGQTQD
jgi:hypothetical protein